MSVSTPTAAAEPEQTSLGVQITRRQALAHVLLDRPRALNALNDAMRSAIAAAIPGFARDPDIYALVIAATGERAFCAGGDLRELTATARADVAAGRRSLALEYRLNWQLECFTKPTVSLIDGLVVGSGVGLTLFGTHRVAGERYAFAMPETAIGFFPDVGVAHALARMPDGAGLYLGLTGRTIARADALALGLVTHCIDAKHFGDIEAGLSLAELVDPLLDSRHIAPGPGELAQHRQLLAYAFAEAGDLETTMTRLREASGVAGPSQTFASGIIGDLMARSPMALKVTFRHIRSAAALDLKATLEQDYRIAARMVAGGDLFEGTRAMLIDKDRAPQWQPATGATISQEMVETYFESAPGGDLGSDLALPSRADMQAQR